eukprot:TRINITY_DN2476_c0_g1_i31.p1 TRINITY_DN2476_c0_g1~~TRINITY_DN2476_c0_g1_i31.p1  ORF type:complete len:148 (-),score=31.51 TRINITY_DN2476_c0_g1_i31:61-504(-)
MPFHTTIPRIFNSDSFSVTVRVKSFTIIAKETANFPDNARIFLNQENVDFAFVEDADPVQEVTLIHNISGEVEYAVKQTKFQNVNTLILHMRSSTFDKLQITYIGFKGVKTNIKRGIVIATYEAKPQLSDHKVKDQFESQYLSLIHI